MQDGTAIMVGSTYVIFNLLVKRDTHFLGNIPYVCFSS